MKLLNQWYDSKSTVTDNNGKQRNYYIDNLKFVLITLVVFGHFGLKFTYIKEIRYLLYFIYVFHMPCFVFVSGFLSKRMNSGGKLRAEKILSVFWMYLVFKVGNVLLGYAFHEKVQLSLFKDRSAPWYLMAIGIWYLLIPLLERIKTNYLVAGSFLVGLAVGYLSIFNDTFSLSRVLVFLPFFVLGFSFPEKKLEELLDRHLRPAAALILAVVLGFFLICGKYLTPVDNILYGSSPYSAFLKGLAPYGLLIRGIWYLSAILLSIAVMLLVPRCSLFFSKYGERTMQIYILHIWCRSALGYIGFFSLIKSGPHYLAVLVLLGSIGLTFFLANRYLKKLFDALMAVTLFKKLCKNE